MVRDHDGDLAVASTWAVVGKPPVVVPPVGPVPQPATVSVPGSHGSELGCPTARGGGTQPGDWDPACAQAQLDLDANDQIWKATARPGPPGGYAFKAAINKAWDENYGVGGVANGADVGYTTDGSPVTVLLRPPHALGHQRPDQRRRRGDRQLPERDGLHRRQRPRPACGPGSRTRTATRSTASGSPTSRPAPTRSRSSRTAAHPGRQQTFTVDPGDVTTFTYDPATSALTVSTSPPG